MLIVDLCDLTLVNNMRRNFDIKHYRYKRNQCVTWNNRYKSIVYLLKKKKKNLEEIILKILK